SGEQFPHGEGDIAFEAADIGGTRLPNARRNSGCQSRIRRVRAVFERVLWPCPGAVSTSQLHSSWNWAGRTYGIPIPGDNRPRGEAALRGWKLRRFAQHLA